MTPRNLTVGDGVMVVSLSTSDGWLFSLFIEKSMRVNLLVLKHELWFHAYS